MAQKYPPHAQIAGSWFRLETLRVHSVLYLLYVSYTPIIYSHVVCIDTWVYVQCFWKESMIHSVPILADTLEYTLMVTWEHSRISGAHCISQPLGRHLSASVSSADRSRLYFPFRATNRTKIRYHSLSGRAIRVAHGRLRWVILSWRAHGGEMPYLSL